MFNHTTTQIMNNNIILKIIKPSTGLNLAFLGLLFLLNFIPSSSLNHQGCKSRISQFRKEGIGETYDCCAQGHLLSRLLDNYGLYYHHPFGVDVLPCNRHNGWNKGAIHHRMLAEKWSSMRSKARDEHSNLNSFLSPSPSPSPSPSSSPSPSPSPSPSLSRTPQIHNKPLSKQMFPTPTSISNANPSAPLPKPTPSPPPLAAKEKTTTHPIPIALGAVGGFIVLVFVIVGIYLCRRNKITVVRPWRTGLTGQLQKALVTGISNLKRSELECACEDFSNVVGSSSIGTMYKGTLSNGVEIAVISLSVTSSKDWSRNLETQFRKKIEALSKVNHKNFVNLIGYCKEEKPFTRMMVFEYAPNGSLFEHLHVKEAEHLDWGMRLRIAMGMAYALEHMHQLVPPVIHHNLSSSAVNLSDDYAAKLCDFCFWNEVSASQVQPLGVSTSSTTTSSATTLESNVYSFGIVLLEMMTGRIPLSMDYGSLEDWVLDYLSGEQHLRELVDSMLRSFDLAQLEKLSDMIRKCLHVDPMQRPVMKDIAGRIREITGINRDKAYPRLSPLWWAELEVASVNGD